MSAMRGLALGIAGCAIGAACASSTEPTTAQHLLVCANADSVIVPNYLLSPRRYADSVALVDKVPGDKDFGKVIAYLVYAYPAGSNHCLTREDSIAFHGNRAVGVSRSE